MINLRVIRLNDIVKILLKLLITLVIVIVFFKFFRFIKNVDIKNFIKAKFDYLNNKTFLECINENIGEIIHKNNEQKSIDNNIIEKELGFINFLDMEEDVDKENEEIVLENQEASNSNEEENIRNLPTEVISENNKKDTYTNEINGVQIKNGTSYDLTEAMLTPDIDFNNKKDIVIFHTHTCESYTATEQYNYTQTGNFRTTDLNYSVARVGTELTNLLVDKGYNVIHDTTYHDYPEYSGSYTRSLQTVQTVLQSTPAELVIDLHRDALGDSSYGPRVKIGDEYAAQLMFVMGSAEGGLYHPNWNENLKLAIKIQQKANEMYPGLFKPIMLTKYRYNQSTARGACIIEVGATGNTLEETLNSMKYLAEVISEVMK